MLAMAKKKKTKEKTVYKAKKLFLKTLPGKMLIGTTPFIIVVCTFLALYAGKVYPGVYVGESKASGKTAEELAQSLAQNSPIPGSLVLLYGDQKFTIPLKDIDFSYNYGQSAARAYSVGRSANVVASFGDILRGLFSKNQIGFAVNLSEEKLTDFLYTIAGQVEVDPISPSVSVVKGEVNVDPGKTGIRIDRTKLRGEIAGRLSSGSSEPIEIPTQEIDTTLSQLEVDTLLARAQKLVGKKIVLHFEYDDFVLTDTDLVSFLDAGGGYSDAAVVSKLTGTVDPLDRPPQDAKFSFEGGRVKEFEPAKDGISVQRDTLKNDVINTTQKLEEGEDTTLTLEIPVTKSAPKVDTDSVNNLGIKELIGRGKSQFRGSISSRVYNINLAASRLNGVLIKPGEIFSFNGAVGDVSALTGYKQAYIIQDGRTILGDGGGLCQVSTTMFRAALNAGLPIIERRAHSYRVGYYEQDEPAGLDATVYSPTTDFKFKNDTPGHILVQAYPDTRNLTLVFELYGTSDGRVSKISRPVVTDPTPPPDPLYIDDPTLPTGTTKQIDWAAWGAKSKFTYTVTRNGDTLINKTFYSNYQPWQAKYLVGTGPAE